jgi:AraC family transcriptional regulator
VDKNTLPETMDHTRSLPERPAKSPPLPVNESAECEVRVVLERSRKPSQAGLSEIRLHAILEFIEASLHLRVSVADMAAVVHLSPFHFSRAFTKTVGQAPHTFLTLRRLERAKQLLATGDLPLRAIARQVGYRAHSHFTDVFVRFVGMTPRRYRDSVSRRRQDNGNDAEDFM